MLAIAAALRAYFIDPDLTYDELWHLALSTGRGTPFGIYPQDILHLHPAPLTSLVGAPGWWHIWTGGMDGVLHPPLYLVTLRWWRDVFGGSDVAAIWYSITWSLVALAFTFAAMRLATDRWLAFAVTAAMGISQSQAYFAQEVRGYSMLIGLAAISLWVMTRIEILGPTRRRAVGVALLTLPMLLTHYFAFGAAIAIAVHGLIRLRGHRRAFLIALGAAALTYVVIWVPWAIQQIDYIGTGDAFMKRPLDLTYELGMLASGPMRLIVDRLFIRQPQWLAGGVLFVLPFLLLRRARWLLPFALWLVFCLFSLLALDVIRSTALLFMARYLAVATPAVFVLAAGCAWVIHRGLAYAVVLTLGLMGFVYLISNSGVEGECPTFAAVERGLDANVREGEGLIFYHGVLYEFTGDALMLQASHSTKMFPRPMAVISGPMKPELVAQFPRHTWLVTGTITQPIESIIPGARLIKRISIDINVAMYYLELPVSTATPSVEAPTSGPSTAPSAAATSRANGP